MTRREIHALAEQVLRDRLVGFAVNGGAKGRVTFGRIAEPTAAEIRWDAFLKESR